MIPPPPDRLRIAAAALMPPRGVLKAYRNPDQCKPSTLARVRRAAEELGLPAPSEPATTEAHVPR